MKLFIDSSLLVEYVKNTKTELLEYLVASESDLYISSTVVSEFFFHYLAIRGGKSPLTLKVNRQIASCLKQGEYTGFLQQFGFLEDLASVVTRAPELMQRHNLLPNDALILATCLHHSLPYLASYDENDFRDVCTAEGITLISSVDEAKQLLAD
ncbi:type II toxin-antitoxin system VapC family toxin [Tunicatimonas pelagia]|uniref:type II toxin-antitoxin system VapC family toxin n=1 Tax=Tunicatimonas pelagia TaxID=931531 RepID=UPI002665CF83|nr:type II toxin-antitoxin system VapC family toxin [Tunicatimonas pelagia]WKN44603.1 type II toxin-antitoxin system VapC family toxin [Tunicatimonas pelagia]